MPSHNGFLFPTKMRGKRARSPKTRSGKGTKFNMPMPNGFFFPSTGKRSSESPAAMWNLAKPNGFFFPSVQKPKRLVKMVWAGWSIHLQHFCSVRYAVYHQVLYSWAENQTVGSFFLQLFGQPKSAIKAASHCCPAPTAHRLTLCLEHPSTIFFNTLMSSNWSELTAGNSWDNF